MVRASSSDDFYIEIQNNGLDIQDQCRRRRSDIAEQARPAARGDVRRPLPVPGRRRRPRRAAVHQHRQEARPGPAEATRKGRCRASSTSARPEEMYQLFPDLADAVARSQEIADGVDIQLDFKKRHFPVFTPPDGKTPEDYLRELCEQGLKERYGDNPPPEVAGPARARAGHHLPDGLRQLLPDRLGLRPLRPRERHPGSARGSACGAVVSYVLKLSHVDPLEYDLLFERFLDPNRSEAPDIDIDFCQDRREEVIAVRQAEVRRGERRPDRHVRHAGGEGGAQGRRPGARRAARARQLS